MKIIVIADAHANLPALRAVLEEIDQIGYDQLFHIGDAIAIGPQPRECVELLLETPRSFFIRGNHESYFTDGIRPKDRESMSGEELLHQQWTHAQLSPRLRNIMSEWPYVIEREFKGCKTTFLHYGLDESGRDFVWYGKNPSPSDLDKMFGDCNSEIIFYGHSHFQSDTQGQKRHINPGSLGCSKLAEARYCIAEFDNNDYFIEYCSAPYDDHELYETFEKREVPAREFIYKAFFGNRFTTNNS